MIRQKEYAFIGGGSTGPILLIYLAKLASDRQINLRGFVFHLIDPDGYCNGGIAYGKSAPKHTLNTRRNEMSPWKPDAFRAHLLAKGRPDNDRQFDLRADFCDFLMSEFARAKGILEGLGVTFQEHRKLAYVRQGQAGGFDIIDAASQPIAAGLCALPAEHIILAVGYGPNTAFAALRQHAGQGYIDTLYPPNELIRTLRSKLKQRKPVRVAVLGSAAALYDCILACPLRPKEMELLVFSSATAGQEIRQVDIEHTFKDIDFKHLNAVPAHATVQDIEQAVELEFADAAHKDAGADTWVAFRIMSRIGAVLQRLDTETAQRFRSSLFFKRLKRLGGPTTAFSKARLEDYTPKFIPIELSPANITAEREGGFAITTADKTFHVDCIVNASGHGRHNSAILEDMKAHGLAEIEPKLGVLRTDVSGVKLAGSGITCIGPAVHFGTDGIETFARPAEVAAASIIARITQRSIPTRSPA